MNQNIILITIFIMLLGFWILQRQFGTGSAAKISPVEAKKLLDSHKGVVLLDVRTRDEYQEKHIPNSILIPIGKITKEISRQIKDKNAVIVVYCASGARSTKATRILSDLGYTNIYNMGGILNWPYETVSGRA